MRSAGRGRRQKVPRNPSQREENETRRNKAQRRASHEPELEGRAPKQIGPCLDEAREGCALARLHLPKHRNSPRRGQEARLPTLSRSSERIMSSETFGSAKSSRIQIHPPPPGRRISRPRNQTSETRKCSTQIAAASLQSSSKARS